MREIRVSTDVFARIWALRQPGEDSEDAVLRRVLSCEPFMATSSGMPSPSADRDGVYDQRFDVSFPEGFEVFRTYLGINYRAVAKGGRWVLLADGRSFKSLNELSRAIGAKTENAWINWFYLTSSGERRPISDLRNPSRITPRRRSIEPGDVSPHNSSSINIEEIAQASTNPGRIDGGTVGDGTWRSDVVEALKSLGGKAPLHRIYTEVESIRKAAGRSIPRTLDATIRQTLESHSSDSENYRGGPDLFQMPEGRGAGVWALR